ncbi:MAG: type II toxin-antitoxin system ParD family antitoxin [Nitratireductor sp.]
MATMNVSLPDGMKDWVGSHQDGGFANTSDYVRHLIRKEQQRSKRLRLLQRALTRAGER